MYQNPFLTRRPVDRGQMQQMGEAEARHDTGVSNLRQQRLARRNPLMQAKPIRYDDPKGGYQQPGAPATGAYPPGAYAKPLNQVYADPKGGAPLSREQEWANHGRAQQQQEWNALPAAERARYDQATQQQMGGGMHDRPVVREPIDRFANDDSIRNVSRNGQPKSPAALEMLRRRQLA
jgi:uncharacterized protein YdcH (DUF465 family)